MRSPFSPPPQPRPRPSAEWLAPVLHPRPYVAYEVVVYLAGAEDVEVSFLGMALTASTLSLDPGATDCDDDCCADG